MAVTAEQYREELVQDAFINGIASAFIHQRLLENKSLNLEAAYSQCRTLHLAQHNANAHTSPVPVPQAAAALVPGWQEQSSGDQQQQPMEEEAERSPGGSLVTAAHSSKKKCYFCANVLHITGGVSRPAHTVTCNKCGKAGHFAKICRSNKAKAAGSTTATLYNATLLTSAATSPKNLSHAAKDISHCKWSLTEGIN